MEKIAELAGLLEKAEGIAAELVKHEQAGKVAHAAAARSRITAARESVEWLGKELAASAKSKAKT